MVSLASDGLPETAPEGGRFCSLEYRPRRWFGFRLDRVLREFLATEMSEFAGLGMTVTDLLQGVVRPGSDRKVRVSAHHSRTQGVVLATVEVTYRVPSSDPEHAWAIAGWLGRTARQGTYFRLGTPGGELPVRATLTIDTELVCMCHGETEFRTTFVVRAGTRARRNSGFPHRGGESRASSGQVIPIRGS